MKRTIKLKELSAEDSRKISKELYAHVNIADVILRALLPFTFTLSEICNKPVGDNEEMFGYYLTRCVDRVYFCLQMLGAKSMVDLGCGMGIMIRILQEYGGSDIKYGGIELNQALCKVCRQMTLYDTKIKNKNLLDLTKDDVEKYDTLYMWEPIKDRKMGLQFVNNLVPLLHPNQTIILNSAGHIIEHLRKHEEIKEVKGNNIPLTMFHRI